MLENHEKPKVNTMKIIQSIILVTILGLFAFAGNTRAQCESYPKRAHNIVELARSSDNLSTLVQALKAGDLAETLQGEGPYTVFAPTNAAFEALPEGTLESLLKPENKEKLVQILTYHVVPGKNKSSDLTDGMMAKTVQGKAIKIKISGGNVNIHGASVTSADRMATNGVVHVIDKVILPPEK